MGLSPTVTPTSAATGSEAPAATAVETVQASSGLASDFETFLRLLTAQLSNQDPLKPMESTEFVSQLASFSAVEQQTRTNSLLEQMTTSLAGQGVGDLSDWIGRNVGVAGPVTFDGQTPVSVRVPANPLAQSARLDIYDDFGTLVASQPVPADATETEWQGVLPSGSLAAAGSYRMTASYFVNGELISQADAMSEGQVVEVRLDDRTSTSFRLADGRQISSEEISAIYQ